MKSGLDLQRCIQASEAIGVAGPRVAGGGEGDGHWRGAVYQFAVDEALAGRRDANRPEGIPAGGDHGLRDQSLDETSGG